MQNLSNLVKALQSFVDDHEFAPHLAKILNHAHKASVVFYWEIENNVKSNTKDILLFAYERKLLLPVKTKKSSSWEDRLFSANPEEMFEMPNIIKYLVNNALKSGIWSPVPSIKKLFHEMGEQNPHRISKVAERICKEAMHERINARQIKEICNDFGVGDRVDTLIAELKGSGILSPKLNSFIEVFKAGSPIYDINPSVFVTIQEVRIKKPV